MTKKTESKAMCIAFAVAIAIIAYNIYMAWKIRSDHRQEYDMLYGQFTQQYRTMGLIVAAVVAVAVYYGLHSYYEKS